MITKISIEWLLQQIANNTAINIPTLVVGFYTISDYLFTGLLSCSEKGQYQVYNTVFHVDDVKEIKIIKDNIEIHLSDEAAERFGYSYNALAEGIESANTSDIRPTFQESTKLRTPIHSETTNKGRKDVHKVGDT